MKRTRKPYSDEDDIPELSDAFLRTARPVQELMPPELYASLPKRRPGQRGKQKTPVKQAVTLRLDAEIVRHFKATGTGWQSRINNFLKAAVVNLV